LALLAFRHITVIGLQSKLAHVRRPQGLEGASARRSRRSCIALGAGSYANSLDTSVSPGTARRHAPGVARLCSLVVLLDSVGCFQGRSRWL